MIEKIDYTLLNPYATQQEILDLCDKAKNFKVKSVCVLPDMVSTANTALTGSDVLVCTVVSFPHGTDTTEQKLAETKFCIANGADEVDMVLNYPELKNICKNIDFDNDENNSDETNEVFLKQRDILVNEVETLVSECHSHINKNGDKVTLKVIVESGLLTKDETVEATYICLESKADFIKTSTGMVSVGAELDKVKIMYKIINDCVMFMKIKASGGLRTMEDLKKFEHYVDRFGVGFAAVDKIFGEIKSNNIETSY